MKKTNFNWRLLFGAVMVMVYLGMGSMLIFSGWFNVDRTLGVIVGILFMLYGVFRGIRVYRSLE